jgi:hypothetical protein
MQEGRSSTIENFGTDKNAMNLEINFQYKNYFIASAYEMGSGVA